MYRQSNPDYRDYDYKVSTDIMSQLKDHFWDEYKIELHPNPKEFDNYSESNIYFVMTKDEKDYNWVLSSNHEPLKLCSGFNKFVESLMNTFVKKNDAGKQNLILNHLVI